MSAVWVLSRNVALRLDFSAGLSHHQQQRPPTGLKPTGLIRGSWEAGKATQTPVRRELPTIEPNSSLTLTELGRLPYRRLEIGKKSWFQCY